MSGASSPSLQCLLAPSALRHLTHTGLGLGDEQLARLYLTGVGDGADERDVPAQGWVRASFVSTLDGSTTGADGVSGSINTPADFVVFQLVRALSDVVVVGAGTVAAERYSPLSPPARFAAIRERLGLAATLPLVVVSARGRVPACAMGPDVYLATCEDTDTPDAAELGPARVLRCGRGRVDLRCLRELLVARGWPRILLEGGPTLLHGALADGVVDELCLTLVPSIVGGTGPRLVTGDLRTPVPALPLTLLHGEGSLLGRWLLGPAGQ